MTISLTASDIHDARMQLGQRTPSGAIVIRWRLDPTDGSYGRLHATGCIVDATSIHGEEVPRRFQSAAEAMRYVGALLKRHDTFVRDETKKRELAKRAADKKTKGA